MYMSHGIKDYSVMYLYHHATLLNFCFEWSSYLLHRCMMLCLWSAYKPFTHNFSNTALQMHWCDQNMWLNNLWFLHITATHAIFLILTVVDCGTLNNPTNGEVNHTAGTTFRQTAIYSCNTGYNLVGSSTRTCQVTGVWSGSAPTCERMLLLELEKYV